MIEPVLLFGVVVERRNWGDYWLHIYESREAQQPMVKLKLSTDEGKAPQIGDHMDVAISDREA